MFVTLEHIRHFLMELIEGKIGKVTEKEKIDILFF